jgi:hypothetical protein
VVTDWADSKDRGSTPLASTNLWRVDGVGYLSNRMAGFEPQQLPQGGCDVVVAYWFSKENIRLRILIRLLFISVYVHNFCSTGNILTFDEPLQLVRRTALKTPAGELAAER